MDKRKKRTSAHQYTIYLKALRNDYIFRIGKVPGNNAEAVKRKWRELAVEFNECPDGPKLEPEEWRKRFMDWKHSTRSKYRKSLQSNNKNKIIFTALEKQGIDLWDMPFTRKKIKSEEISPLKDYDDLQFDDDDDIIQNDDTSDDEERGEEYLEITNEDLKAATEILQSLPLSSSNLKNIGKQLKRLADIEQDSLRFEIVKFKFKNPGFQFDHNYN